MRMLSLIQLFQVLINMVVLLVSLLLAQVEIMLMELGNVRKLMVHLVGAVPALAQEKEI
jgi:hypothetical protein